MKQLNETFDDEEFNALKKFKNGMTWREFILFMFKHCKEADKRGDFEIYKK